MWNTSLPDRDLAFLPLDTEEAEEYTEAMNFAQDFARASRSAMMEAMMISLEEESGRVDFGEVIDIHHNYARREEHYNKEVIVHRKGATSAKKGETGIIPGSQGMKSYIVKGKGKPESFMSCSHGAGRKMGRRQAIRELGLEYEKKQLDDKGIIHAIRTKKDLDEASGAYKDIDMVMKDQEDLVEISVQLSPLAVIKA